MADNAASLAVDWSTTQQINLARVEAGSVAKVTAILKELEAETIKILDQNKSSVNKQAKLEIIRDEAHAAIEKSYAKIKVTHGEDLQGVAKAAGKGAAKQINYQIGVNVADPVLTDKQLEKLASDTLVFGAKSNDWWQGQEAGLKDKFLKQMRMGYGLGESVEELSRRVRGTKANGFNDGIMSTSRREAEALVRSSIQTISNQARIDQFTGMQPLVKGIQWIATLDGRTTLTCMGLDKLQWRLPDYEPIGHSKKFPGPTGHWGCRSTQIAVTRSWEELSGMKIPALDDQTLQKAVELRLGKEGMPADQIAKVKVRARASMDGQIAQGADFETWLKGKPPEFVNDVLGPSRAALWQEGKLTLKDLTDQTGRPLTVKALEAAIDGDTLPDETEGVDFTPYIAEALAIGAVETQYVLTPLSKDETQAYNDEATAKMAEILANPKGQTLKAKAIQQLQKSEPDLPPVLMLAKAETIAAEKQAAASKASVLSTAKKKLLAGEDPTPAQKAVIDALSDEEKANWESAINDAKGMANNGKVDQMIADVEAAYVSGKNPSGLISQTEYEALNSDQAFKYDQAVMKFTNKAHIDQLSNQAASGADPEFLIDTIGNVVKKANDPDIQKHAEAAIAKIQDQQVFDEIGELTLTPEGEASINAAKAKLPPGAPSIDLLKQAKIELEAINNQADADATSSMLYLAKNPEGQTLKAKALANHLGVPVIKLDGMGADAIKNAIKAKGLPPKEVLAKIEAEAAEKQAAASKASKLSTAKKKLLEGKQPSPSEQATIDSLTPEEKASWQESVKQGQSLQSAPVVGLKVQVEETTLDSKKGLAALAKQPQIAGTEYEDWLDYLTPEELAQHKVNALPIVEMSPEWEAGEVVSMLSDSDKAKIPNQITKVALADTITTQVFITTPYVEHYLQTGKTDSSNPAHLGKPPLVIKLGGKFQVHDGNHRANAYLLAGEKEMPALVYDLDTAIATDPKNEMVQKIFGGDPPAKMVAIAKAAYAQSNPVVKAATAAATTKQTKAGKVTLTASPIVATTNQSKKAPALPPAENIPKPETLKIVKKLGGSTGAQLAVDSNGKKWVVKKGNSPDHVRAEHEADQLYRLLGANVPDGGLFEGPGGPVKVTEFLEGGKTLAELSPAEKKKAHQALKDAMPIDAVFGNWDVVGLGADNVMVTPDGKVWRIDNGGSMEFRAQGAIKTTDEWNEYPVELWTMRDKAKNGSTAVAFGEMDIYEMASKIEAIDWSRIDDAPVSDQTKQTLKRRAEEAVNVAKRARDFQKGQYKAEYTERVAFEGLMLRKDGLGQSMPQVVKVKTHTDITIDGKKWGNLRAPKSSTTGTSATPKMAEDYYSPAIEVAIKSIAHKSINSSPITEGSAMTKAAAAVDQKILLEAMAKSAKQAGNKDLEAMANHNLKAIAWIEKQMTKGGVPETPAIFKPYAPKGAKAAPVADTRSVVMRWEAKMQAEGISTAPIRDWLSSQSGNSWTPATQAAKYAYALGFENPKDAQYWEGNNSYKTSFEKCKKQFDDVAKKLGGEDKAKRLFESYHALVQETLSNITDAPWFDTERRAVLLVRTVTKEELEGSGKKTTAAGTFTALRGTTESHSIYKKTSVYGNQVTMQAVPYSRIHGLYWLERYGGHSGSSFLGDGEAEFAANTSGLPCLHDNGYKIDINKGSDASKWGVPIDHL